MKQALIIVDVQNDYFEGGSMELVAMEEAAANCRRLLDGFRAAGGDIVHVQHLSTRPGSTFFVPGTRGSEIHESMAPRDGEELVTKNYPSAFRGTALERILGERGVEELVICGAMTHMCIDTTTRAAFDLGFRCIVAHDACATRDLVFEDRVVPAADVQAAFMAALGAPFAAILDAAAVLEAGRR